jgi:hypothetical protein
VWLRVGWERLADGRGSWWVWEAVRWKFWSKYADYKSCRVFVLLELRRFLIADAVIRIGVGGERILGSFGRGSSGDGVWVEDFLGHEFFTILTFD